MEQKNTIEIRGIHNIKYEVNASLAPMYQAFEPHRFDNIWPFFTVLFASAFSFRLLNQILARRWSNNSDQLSKANRALVNNSVSLVHSIVSTVLIHYEYVQFSNQLLFLI